MPLWVRTHQGGHNRLSIAFTLATEIQSRPPVKSFFLKPPPVKRQIVIVMASLRRRWMPPGLAADLVATFRLCPIKRLVGRIEHLPRSLRTICPLRDTHADGD